MSETPAYISPDRMFRSLTAEEVQQFQEHARTHEPDLDDWEILHPVCREEWQKLGKGPTTPPLRERVQWPTGWAEVRLDLSVNSAEGKRAQQFRKALPAQNGRRKNFYPEPSTPATTWKDPIKGRSLTLILDELQKVAAKMDDSSRSSCEKAIGKLILPHYRIVSTNGHFAIAKPGADAAEGERPMFEWPTAMAIATDELWRALGRVRVCRPQRSGAIRVDFARGAIRLSARDTDTECEAVEVVPTMCDVRGTLSLADGYLWPIRGHRWFLGLTGSPEKSVFVAWTEGLAFVLMSLRT